MQRAIPIFCELHYCHFSEKKTSIAPSNAGQRSETYVETGVGIHGDRIS